jgi:hypothetical protein
MARPRLQLVEAIPEVATGIGKEQGRIQWQHPVAQRLATFTQYDGGHFEHVLE